MLERCLARDRRIYLITDRPTTNVGVNIETSHLPELGMR